MSRKRPPHWEGEQGSDTQSEGADTEIEGEDTEPFAEDPYANNNVREDEPYYGDESYAYDAPAESAELPVLTAPESPREKRKRRLTVSRKAKKRFPELPPGAKAGDTIPESEFWELPDAERVRKAREKYRADPSSVTQLEKKLISSAYIEHPTQYDECPLCYENPTDLIQTCDDVCQPRAICRECIQRAEESHTEHHLKNCQICKKKSEIMTKKQFYEKSIENGAKSFSDRPVRNKKKVQRDMMVYIHDPGGPPDRESLPNPDFASEFDEAERLRELERLEAKSAKLRKKAEKEAAEAGNFLIGLIRDGATESAIEAQSDLILIRKLGPLLSAHLTAELLEVLPAKFEDLRKSLLQHQEHLGERRSKKTRKNAMPGEGFVLGPAQTDEVTQSEVRQKRIAAMPEMPAMPMPAMPMPAMPPMPVVPQAAPAAVAVSAAQRRQLQLNAAEKRRTEGGKRKRRTRGKRARTRKRTVRLF